jgi:hypothetical protein
MCRRPDSVFSGGAGILVGWEITTDSGLLEPPRGAEKKARRTRARAGYHFQLLRPHWEGVRAACSESHRRRVPGGGGSSFPCGSCCSCCAPAAWMSGGRHWASLGCRELALTWLAAGGEQRARSSWEVCVSSLSLWKGPCRLRRLGSDQVKFLWLRRPKEVLLGGAAAHDLGCESNMMMYVAAGDAANASQLRALGVQSRATGTGRPIRPRRSSGKPFHLLSTTSEKLKAPA